MRGFESWEENFGRDSDPERSRDEALLAADLCEKKEFIDDREESAVKAGGRATGAGGSLSV